MRLQAKMRDKEETARLLAGLHYKLDDGVTAIYRLLSDDENESESVESVKLLEVNTNTTTSGIRPVYFGPDNARGIFHPLIIIEVTPEEFEDIEHGDLSLPDNWQLGQIYPREAASQLKIL